MTGTVVLIMCIFNFGLGYALGRWRKCGGLCYSADSKGFKTP